MSVLVHEFASQPALTERLADFIASQLQIALDERGEASLVVSGGSTPKPVFAALSEKMLDWRRVWVTLADERWVPPDHTDSNEKLVREHLMVNEAAKARFVSLWNDQPTPEAGLDATRLSLAVIPRPFDVVILGMGDDAHTASLFPGAANLQTGLTAPAEAQCVPMVPLHAPHARMTLTRSALLQTRHLVLHIVGESKRKVFDEALAGTEVEAQPIRAFLHQDQVALEVYWAG